MAPHTETTTQYANDDGHATKRLPRALVWTAVALFALVVLVCIRSWVFLVYPHAHFDSDQAIFGVMAKDLLARRAIPMFTYGRGYMLAISVWLAAPAIALFGSSVFALKFPMLLMNLAVVGLLWLGLRRDGLDRLGAAISILPFAIPSVATSSKLVEHAGGNIEPFPLILAFFFLRDRAVLLGIVMGVAYLNREFALIGLIALLILDLVHGRIKAVWKTRLLAIAVTAGVIWSIKAVARRFTRFDDSGPGVVGDPAWANVVGFFKTQLPSLIGAAHRHLTDYNITSALKLGRGSVYFVVGAWMLVVLFFSLRSRPSRLGEFSSYLVLVGGGQAAAFMLLVATPFDPALLRYVLLSLFLLVGLAALGWAHPRLRWLTAVCVGFAALSNLADHGRLIAEYLRDKPRHENELLADELERRGVKYLVAEYWVAFDVAWLTDERVIASPREDARVRRYIREFGKHPSEVWDLSGAPCPGGEPVMRWVLCPEGRSK